MKWKGAQEVIQPVHHKCYLGVTTFPQFYFLSYNENYTYTLKNKEEKVLVV